MEALKQWVLFYFTPFGFAVCMPIFFKTILNNVKKAQILYLSYPSSSCGILMVVRIIRVILFDLPTKGCSKNYLEQKNCPIHSSLRKTAPLLPSDHPVPSACLLLKPSTDSAVQLDVVELPAPTHPTRAPLQTNKRT
jgi:hypothetical protein